MVFAIEESYELLNILKGKASAWKYIENINIDEIRCFGESKFIDEIESIFKLNKAKCSIFEKTEK